MENNNTPRFIRVTKSNKDHDRGFIAVDAICSVFENRATRTVSVMTMDGFWYDVEDDIEKLYGLVTGDHKARESKSASLVYVGDGIAASRFMAEAAKNKSQVSSPKKQYLRKKKMLAPIPGSSVVQRNHTEEIEKGNSEQGNFTKGLPTGVGKGQHKEQPMDVFTPPSDENI